MGPNQSFTNRGMAKGDVVYIHSGILLAMKKDKVGSHYSFHAEIFLSLTFKFCFVCGGWGFANTEGRCEGWGDEWDHDVKSINN